MRILVGVSDKRVASLVEKGLKAEAYAVDLIEDPEDFPFIAEEYEYDLAILDLDLFGSSGLGVLRRIKSEKPALAILVLAANCPVQDRVKTLDLGADDCMTKPFSFSELSARVRALLRRGTGPVELTFRVADLERDCVHESAKRAGRPINLTAKEFALLEYLMRNAGNAVTRAMIIEHVWGLSFTSMTNVVDVYINYLRKKVDAGFEHRLVRTIRGIGYALKGED
jgi:DNA-binding response OmpR family regulator